MSAIYTLGIDVGSTASKCIMLKDGQEIVAKSLIDVGAGTSGPQRAIDAVLENAGMKKEDVAFTLATGYGRNSLMNFADKQMSELSCHARGAYFLFPDVHTVIDIGGQDVKVLHIDNGAMTNFQMNDKCAAGTGRFLDVMAGVLEVKVQDLGHLDSLSKKKVDEQKGFEEIIKAKEEGTVLESVVQHVVKGGVIVSYAGVRVFIPASQSGLPRGTEMDVLLKTPVKFIILEVNEGRRRAVGSIKAVQKAEKEAAKEKFWETAEIGKVYKGEVKSLTSYGAFVDLGGIDGMVHISELSWKRIKHPSEVVNVGDYIEVYIKDLDKEANRISLGYKKTEDNPWEKFKANYKVGDVIPVTIVSITPFGAFAQIIEGVDGLIHISQLADKRVENVKDIVSVGDQVNVKIIDIDIENKRISISMRALLEDSDENAEEDAPAEDAE